MTRTAAEVGAGLAPVRAPRAIVPRERIHVVGVAGAGASAAALLAVAAGATVSGCDAGGPSPYTAALEAAGIPVVWNHDAAHVTGSWRPNRLAVSKALTAVAPDHPELLAAVAGGIPIEPWQQVVADAAAGTTLVGVAGTHGKSTTSGWLTHVLTSAGRDPSAFVGALLPSNVTGGGPATARIGKGDVFVVEADEYAGNFDAFHPDVAVLTSIEWDHPDVFVDLAAVKAAFSSWIGALPVAGVLVANVGDRGVDALLTTRAAALHQRLVVYALTEAPPDRGGYVRAMGSEFATRQGPAEVLLGRLIAVSSADTTIEVSGLDPLTGPVVFRLPTAGRHNVANALAVIAAARTLGLDGDSIRRGVESFAGIGRRLERKGEANGVVVYDDYGHHPTAIRETLAAIRQREPGRRLWAVYEPLTFHRTAALLKEFAAALAPADGVAIADIWAGRDTDVTSTSPEALVAAIGALAPELQVSATGSVEKTADWLAARVLPGDAVLVMGGGRSYRIGEVLLDLLRKERP